MSRSWRFLFVAPSYAPFIGGAQIFQRTIAQQLIDHGHAVTVLTSNARVPADFWQRPKASTPPLPVREMLDGILVERVALAYLPPAPLAFGLLRRAGHWLHRSRLPARFQRPMLRHLARLMPSLPGLQASLARLVPAADLVQAVDSSWDGLFVSVTATAQQHGKPLVAMPLMHLGDVRVMAHFQMAHQIDAYRRATAILALSQREATAYVELGVTRERVHVVPMGVEPLATPASEGLEGSAFRQQYSLTGPIVAFLGANTYDKGAFTLAQAVARLNLQGLPVNLVIAGSQSENLASFLRKTGDLREDRVRLLGIVNEKTKHQLLAACDLLALPSQVDTFGQVMLEAWLHAKPVIGARAGGIPEVIEEGRSGLLVPFGNVDALAQSIAWLLDHPAEATEMGRHGREITLRRWTWPVVYEQMWMVYESCLSR